MKSLEPLPLGVRRGSEILVTLTPDASDKVLSLLKEEQDAAFLRVAIVGGGCNGLSYKLKFVNTPRRGDILVDSGGASVVVDTKSALYLRGTRIDYSNNLIGGGFCFSNPNAKATCSCGESFNR